MNAEAPGAFAGAERAALEAELARAREAVEEANRANAELLAHLQQKIQLPLRDVIGMAELALREDPSPRARAYLISARGAAVALLQGLHDLLSLSAPEGDRLEPDTIPFDLRETLEAVARSPGVAGAGVVLSFRVGRDVPSRVVGDERRLGRLLAALIGNAAAPSKGARVTLTVKPTGTPSAPTRKKVLFCARVGGEVRSPDQLVARFQGLSHVIRSLQEEGVPPAPLLSLPLAEFVGEAFSVESEAGVGSALSLSVEFGVEATVGQGGRGVPSAPRRSFGAPGLRILLLEPPTVHQLLARELLEREGHRVVTACTEREGLEVLAREPVDLCLVDGDLLKAEGLTVARAVRAGRVPGVPSGLPVVALTAHVGPEDFDRFLAAGLDDYLLKPFEIDELEQTLARARMRRRL